MKEQKEMCIICKVKKKRKDAKTCDQHCAGKLAWRTRMEGVSK